MSLHAPVFWLIVQHMRESTSHVGPDATATIKALMAYRGVSATQTATVLGISRASMHRRLSGDSDFSAGEMAALAAFLEVSIARLYAGLDSALDAS